MWFADTLEDTYIQGAVNPLHSSFLFYLPVLLVGGLCYVVDLLIESAFFVIYPNPSDFLRKLVMTKSDIQ